MRNLYKSSLCILVVLLLMIPVVAFAKTNNGRVIKNTRLGTTLYFPKTWGSIKQKVYTQKEGKEKIADVAVFSSRIYEGLNVEVWRITKKLQEHFENSYGPFTLLKQKGNYIYYWSAVEAPSSCYHGPGETIEKSSKKLCELWPTRDSVRDSFTFTKKK